MHSSVPPGRKTKSTMRRRKRRRGKKRKERANNSVVEIRKLDRSSVVTQ